MKDTPNTHGKLALRPKSYVVSVDYKTYFPSAECVEYNYHDFEQAAMHLAWLADQVRGQNGEDAVRRNVVMGFLLTEFLRSKKRDKEIPPIEKFTVPAGRNRPEGGVACLPDFE